MEGGELLPRRVWRPHLREHLLERVELRALGVHVVLVHLDGRTGDSGVRHGGARRRPPTPTCGGPGQHLIGQQEEPLLKGEADHGLNALAGLHLPWGTDGSGVG